VFKNIDISGNVCFLVKQIILNCEMFFFLRYNVTGVIHTPFKKNWEHTGKNITTFQKQTLIVKTT
jgi:hypothetical protein